MRKQFYVQETHIMYFIRRCWFLKCPEGEFMNAILSRVFWVKTQVFWDSSVSWVFYLRFSLLQNAIHEETRVDLSLSVSRIFFVRIFKTRVESGFLSGFFALFVLFLWYPGTAACYEYFINPYTVHTLPSPRPMPMRSVCSMISCSQLQCPSVPHLPPPASTPPLACRHDRRLRWHQRHS